jgi:hypothetical protein
MPSKADSPCSLVHTGRKVCVVSGGPVCPGARRDPLGQKSLLYLGNKGAATVSTSICFNLGCLSSHTSPQVMNMPFHNDTPSNLRRRAPRASPGRYRDAAPKPRKCTAHWIAVATLYLLTLPSVCAEPSIAQGNMPLVSRTGGTATLPLLPDPSRVPLRKPVPASTTGGSRFAMRMSTDY